MVLARRKIPQGVLFFESAIGAETFMNNVGERRVFTAGELNNWNRIVLPILTKLGELRERRHVGHSIQK